MLFLLIILVTFIFQLFSAWWSLALIAFIAAYFYGKGNGHAFLSGFFAIGILWLMLALFQSIPNNNVLAGRVATLFQLPNWILLLAVTVLIGALVGGFAAWSGYLLRKAFSISNYRKIHGGENAKFSEHL